MPDQVGLVESFEVRLGRPRSASELQLVAVVDGVVAAFVYARLTDPDEGAAREMLADRPYRRVHVEALGTANAFQRQGLATQLVEAVEAWAREQGHQRRYVSRKPSGNPVLGAADGLPTAVSHPREASRIADAWHISRPPVSRTDSANEPPVNSPVQPARLQLPLLDPQVAREVGVSCRHRRAKCEPTRVCNVCGPRRASGNPLVDPQIARELGIVGRSSTTAGSHPFRSRWQSRPGVPSLWPGRPGTWRLAAGALRG
jgi:GNAT superfamily N-acetyltransferase